MTHALPRSRAYVVSGAVVMLLLAPAWQVGAVQGARSAPSAVETIFVARSVRESRIAATDYCASSRTHFSKPSVFEDRYTFHAITTQAVDGRVVDTDAGTIATAHGCLAGAAEPGVDGFYLESTFGGVSFSGYGDCVYGPDNFPEAGVRNLRCHLDLGELPARVVGGELTTNTMVSRAAIGTVSDPAGYTQSSIATIRLWTRR